jgi:hypothetical protein
MIQVLPPRNRGPSFGEKLNAGIGNALGMMDQYQHQAQAAKQLENENQALARMGIDLTGVSDPKQRQQYVAAALQGANQRELEMMKQQGRQQVKQQEQDFLGQLFGQKGSAQGQEGNIGNPGQFNPGQLSDADIAQAASINPNLGRLLQSQKDLAMRENREEQKREHEIGKARRKEETEISKPILLELNQSRKNIPLQEQAIEDIQNAVADVSPLDYIADVTGFEPLRSASGAKMKTAIKDFFLSDLSRVGVRPNQWVEQQLADALPKIGRSKEANLMVAAGMKFKVDLAKKRIETIDELAEEDREKFGYVRANIDSRAAKEMSKYTAIRQKELKEEMEKIKKPPAKGQSKTVRIRSPEGEIYEIERNDLEEAQQHGFQLAG